MEEDVLDVSVTDVYDQAAGIGKEFEKLIETYGVAVVTDLMPKVIRTLEQLESLAYRYEKESSEISDLRFTIDKLESEKADKLLERARFEEELVQIEESWQKESKEHLSLIGRLQEDNRQLNLALAETKQAVVEEVAAVVKKTEEKEIEVLTKLKDTVDRQREEIRKYSREIKQKNLDTEALQAQSERLVKINIDLRRKIQSLHRQSKTLIFEKVDIEAQLVEKEQQVTIVKEKLKTQESIDEGKMEIQNQVEDADVIMRRDRMHEDIQTDEHAQTDEEGQDHLVDKVSLIGKIVIDKQDPNRPRFTLNELKTVLTERNELKAKLMEAEEELAIYRPKTRKEICEDEELPVQGPINKEPYEKLYGRKPSGIRKLFASIFGGDHSNEHSEIMMGD